ncbi:hypothetical protein [Streptomyces sp. NPDC029003]|uniref:hypothetical protein n=1 Tax=Streptomyces sp. NPDC029003 TaxID=3155125 RepID=UPI00340FF5A3
MKLKRMAIVAAAAVVGPTVLMATPAMADEAPNAPISTPDAAPAEAAATATPAPATPAAPAAPATAAETPAPAADAAKPAETPAPAADAAKPAETPAPAADASKPATGTPAAKPAAETPAPAAKTAGEAGTQDAAKWVADGPKLAIKDLPSSFKAGGGWQEFTLEVDNTGGKDHKNYSLAVDLMTRTTVKDGYVALEAYLPDEDGNWDWYPAESSGSENEFFLTFGSGAIAKNDKFDIKLRLKFAKNTPATDIALTPAGWSNDEGDKSYSPDNFVESKVEGAGSNGGGSNGGGHTGGGHTGGGNDTKPNGGGTTTPIVDHHTGTGSTGTTGNTGSTTNAGGQLAETGSDAATSWALGAGGVALAMGAALVAGTGRRRRVGA